MESLYLTLGLGPQFLHKPLPGVDDHLPRTIATSVREFCCTYQVHIHHDINTPLLREYDRYLMPIFNNSNFTNKERHILNKCRLYLRVLSIADMATGDGRSIIKSVFEGVRPSMPLRDYEWPI